MLRNRGGRDDLLPRTGGPASVRSRRKGGGYQKAVVFGSAIALLLLAGYSLSSIFSRGGGSTGDAAADVSVVTETLQQQQQQQASDGFELHDERAKLLRDNAIREHAARTGQQVLAIQQQGQLTQQQPQQPVQQQPPVQQFQHVEPVPQVPVPPPPPPPAEGVYALEAPDLHTGVPRPLSEFAGKVTLVVNVASACGYTDVNYKGLVRLQNTYGPRGFQVLAFPCNSFGGQEPGGPEDIWAVASGYGATSFAFFAKTEVNGQNALPVFNLLKAELGAKVEGGGEDLGWNWVKWLVDQRGHPVRRYGWDFNEDLIASDIERLLAPPAG